MIMKCSNLEKAIRLLELSLRLNYLPPIRIGREKRPPLTDEQCKVLAEQFPFPIEDIRSSFPTEKEVGIQPEKEVSGLALGKAAQAWCKFRTRDKTLDVEVTTEFARILDKYIEALQWCSAASDFQEGGQARVGWKKIEDELLTL
jgi:hypothetical protein